jgi:hypothetical protein
MRPSRRRASDNPCVPVEQTTLLYKEAPELLLQLRGQQLADGRELFRLGPGAATRILSSAECGVSW